MNAGGKASWDVRDGDRATTAVLDRATTSSPTGRRTVFVCAHGAGGHKGDTAMLAASDAIRAAGVDVVRFDFYYKSVGSGRPDTMPVLARCIEAVVSRVRTELEPDLLIIGGRSMGGRAASMMAADGYDCDGLVLLAYPLHPAGQPEKLRDAHLSSIPVPTLCFNGTRDELCRRDLMERVALPAQWTMHWIEGADHSFKVLKRSGRTAQDVETEVTTATREWLAALP